jgi:putative transposase
VQQYGAAAIAYLDESGFEPDYPQLYAWAPRGQKVHGERNAQRRPRQNLLAARQGDAFLATMLISGSVNAEVFETWLAEHLCRELTAPSVLILDNARFHRPEAIEAIATAAGHQVLFLPPYSPDFNKIEHDFAALKYIPATRSLHLRVSVGESCRHPGSFALRVLHWWAVQRGGAPLSAAAF